MNVVVAGDYQGKAVVFIDTKNGIGIQTALLKRKDWIPLTNETISKYEVLLDEPFKPSPTRTFRISVDFKDGKRSLIQLEEKFYKILMNKCF
jgi:hypothetical protein